MKVTFFLCALAALLIQFAQLKASEYEPIKPFLKTYCVDCHGPDEQEAGIRVDNFDSIDAQLWSDIFDQIDLEEMPPRKASQPSESERLAIAELILKIASDDRLTITTGLRRLNKREYHNTVTDLLGLEGDQFNPSALIFNDKIDKGFDTNSTNLIISNQLLLEYLRSGERSLRAALFPLPDEAPVKRTTNFKIPSLKPNGHFDRPKYRKIFGGRTSTKVTMFNQSPMYAPNGAEVVYYPGKYRIKVKARGNHQKKLELGFGYTYFGRNISLNQYDITNDEQTYEAVVRMESGARPYITYANGAKKLLVVLRRLKKGKGKTIPGIEITHYSIEGPIEPVWPPKSYAAVFHMDKVPDFEDPEVRNQLLRNFISRAYRRPIVQDEITDYNQYLEAQYKKSNNWREAFIRTFTAVMGSHDFLYIKEELGELSSFQLINRLSYLLWSSMPDQELFWLANNGDLKDPTIYKQQLRRMLSSPKAKEFTSSFATQWLSLDKFGTMRPDNNKSYKQYYKGNTENSMRKETLKYFEHILYKNRPVGEFLDSNYTFLNRNLAELYELPFSGGTDLKLVELPKGSTRGGLLGHGSILALTSNGVETLPVDRGHWVLDELLGIPPPPPPEEVPAIVPDTTNASTPRDLLAKHTEIKSCRECHKLMDPAGLALESFDIIGRDRTRYASKTKIDTTGVFLGESFENVQGLRKILRNNEELFALSLISKVAEYAKGRKLNRKDKDIVRTIVENNQNTNYRFLDMVVELLTSDLILHR